MSLGKLADEFQDVDPIHSFQGSVAAMALNPAKKLASIAQVLGTTRREQTAYIAQVVIVVVKNFVKGITGAGTDWLRQHCFIPKMLPQVTHDPRSVFENSVPGKFLLDEPRYQALIDFCCGLETGRSREIVESAYQAKNSVSAPPRLVSIEDETRLPAAARDSKMRYPPSNEPH